VNHPEAKQDATSNAIPPVYDVAEYKRREEELRNQNQELNELNKQLAARSERNTRILAGMSHEIRTPMHAIMAFAELMEQEILGPLTDKQRDAVGNVHQAGEHLMKLLNDVIDLHRAEVGKLELHLRPVPVDELIDAAYHIIHGLAWEKQINVRISIEPEDIIVNADERRVKQVLHNLLSNAITNRCCITCYQTPSTPASREKRSPSRPARPARRQQSQSLTTGGASPRNIMKESSRNLPSTTTTPSRAPRGAWACQ